MFLFAVSMLNVASMGTILSFLISISCKQSPTIAANEIILGFSVYKFLMAVPPFHSAAVGTEDFFFAPLLQTIEEPQHLHRGSFTAISKLLNFSCCLSPESP